MPLHGVFTAAFRDDPRPMKQQRDPDVRRESRPSGLEITSRKVQVFNGTITVSSIDQNSCAAAESGSILHAIPRDFVNDSWRPRKFVTRPFSCSEHRTGLMRQPVRARLTNRHENTILAVARRRTRRRDR
jgi:hypothetical protein